MFIVLYKLPLLNSQKIILISSYERKMVYHVSTILITNFHENSK